MSRKFTRLFIRASLLVLGLATTGYAQSTKGGPRICPPFEQFLTPTFLDFPFPGISTRG